MPELVSILIPAYNAEKTIKDTIKSAINQTWSKKEIIIVDDGSTDNTLQIARKFESKSVKVVAQQNMGACAARNKALEFAQGGYIQWLDADDLLELDKIAQQLKYGSDGNTSRVLLTSVFGTFFFNQQKAKFEPNSLWQDLTPTEWIITKFTENVWLNPTTWLVSRRLTNLAGPWDERLSSSGDDDGEYICRVVSNSERVKFIPEAKCYYRVGSIDSLSWKSSKELEPLFLSLRLSIDSLRSLEDSERTRNACLKYLQTWFYYFYPERQELIDKNYDLARELGVNLLPPKLSWKYSLIEKIFGLKIAKKIMFNWRKAKSIIVKNWHRLLYTINYCKY